MNAAALEILLCGRVISPVPLSEKVCELQAVY